MTTTVMRAVQADRTVIAAPDECTLARASLARAARAAW